MHSRRPARNLALLTLAAASAVAMPAHAAATPVTSPLCRALVLLRESPCQRGCTALRQWLDQARGHGATRVALLTAAAPMALMAALPAGR